MCNGYLEIFSGSKILPKCPHNFWPEWLRSVPKLWYPALFSWCPSFILNVCPPLIDRSVHTILRTFLISFCFSYMCMNVYMCMWLSTLSTWVGVIKKKVIIIIEENLARLSVCRGQHILLCSFIYPPRVILIYTLLAYKHPVFLPFFYALTNPI